MDNVGGKLQWLGLVKWHELFVLEYSIESTAPSFGGTARLQYLTQHYGDQVTRESWNERMRCKGSDIEVEKEVYWSTAYDI